MLVAIFLIPTEFASGHLSAFPQYHSKKNNMKQSINNGIIKRPAYHKIVHVTRKCILNCMLMGIVELLLFKWIAAPYLSVITIFTYFVLL